MILKWLCQICQLEHMSDNSEKPYLWSYWELKKGYTKPHDYIDLCFKIMRKKGSKYYNVQILDDKTVLNYLPELRTDINQLPLALKADYIRVALLCKYGGLWLDADTIMITDMKEIAELIQNSDFIGFGCTGVPCINSYGRPSNGVMASMPNSRLLNKCLKNLNENLDTYFKLPEENRKEFNYFDLGKLTIWHEYDQLMKEDPTYKYIHYPSYVDGTRDKQGNWVAPDLILRENIDMDEDKLMFVMLANSYYCGKDPKYNWFCKLTEPEILNGKFFIAKLFNMAFNK